MSNPIVYDRDYSFSGFQASNPTEPLPGDEIDGELDSIAASIADIAMKLRNVRRSDGALVNDIVTIDSLSDAVKALLGIGDIEGYITPLTADRGYYVRPDGDDANDGLANTAAGAFRTLQAAADAAYGLDCGGHKVIIYVADGTYTGGLKLQGRMRHAFDSDAARNPFQVIGNIASPANVIISTTSTNAVELLGAALYLDGVTIQTTTGGYGFLVFHGSDLELGTHVRIGNVASEMIACQYNSVIRGSGGILDIVGDADSFAHITKNSLLSLTNCTINFLGAGGNDFGTYVYGINNGSVEMDGCTLTGAISSGRTTIHDRSFVNFYSVTDSMTTSRYGPGTFNVEDGSVLTDTLQSTLNYYVRTDGDDDNDGLANTAARAFKTIQAAVDYLYHIKRDHNQNSAGVSVKINIADGTYSEVVKLRTMAAFESVRIIGNVSTPANVVIAGTTDAINGTKPVSTTYSIESCKLTAAAGSCIRAEAGTQISFTGVNFGSATVAHIQVNAGGTVLCAGSYTISGGGAFHIYAANGGIIDYGAVIITATVAASVAFSTATVQLTNLGVAHIDSTKVTWSLGAFSVTGKRYALLGNSVLNTAGGSASYIPGNASGTLGGAGDSSVYL